MRDINVKKERELISKTFIIAVVKSINKTIVNLYSSLTYAYQSSPLNWYEYGAQLKR